MNTHSKKKERQAQMPISKRSLVLVATLVTLTTVGIVFWYSTTQTAVKMTTTGDTQTAETDSFVVPEVVKADELSNALTIGERKRLENELQKLLDDKKSDGSIMNAGIYFRDLSRGPIIAINENLKFAPASLLKLPLAMWFYYQASTSPSFLTQEIQFVGPKGHEEVHYPSPVGLDIGNIYTYQELIRIMLQYSDNDATAILGGIAGVRHTDSVYTDLGLEPVEDYSKYVTDVQSYGSFFRVLYFGTYLDRSSSNTILSILSTSTFTQGLVAGLPEGTRIAHKFGERPITSTPAHVGQLHDCGIVYPPNKQNYLICVMTQGTSYDKQAQFIADVSKKVYEAAAQ